MEGAEWVVRGRGWGQGGEMNQALYAHMNNKRKRKKKFLHFKGNDYYQNEAKGYRMGEILC
jgi:hypothetical protein